MKFIRKYSILFLAFSLVFFSCKSKKVSVITTKKVAEKKPNIIIILADDMGYSDLGVTGSEIETPNLDMLANKGVLFSNFYNTSRCCPSRASLLTGQYQWDAGMGHMDYTRSNTPEYQGYLNDESITIAEALKLGGYQTFLSGKWHVGSKNKSMWPDKRGFDQYYGIPAGGGVYFYPSKFYKRDVYWNGTQVHPDSTWYSTDAFTDYAINYIEKDKEEKKPFFMYLAYIAPHFPLQAKPEDIEKYKDTYKVGYETIRKARFKKQKELGLFSNNYELPEPESKWEDVENKEEEAIKMAVYAAMVDNLDQNIGKLIASLKKEGEFENTVIFFLSDNGACSTVFNKTPKAEIGTRNSNATYGDWYNVSNTPYRKKKRFEHEGGIKTPMIMHWPKGLASGKVVNKPAHITDFMQTCLQLADVDYPKTYNDVKLDALDGISILPLLNDGEKSADKRTFYWEHEGNKAIRDGKWKLVASHKNEWELYNLLEDPFEINNLVEKHPEMKTKLLSKYNTWTKEHGVLSWPLRRRKSK